MPTVRFLLPDGSTADVNSDPGASVMETAIAHSIDGIVAECGGNAMCATCHVVVEEGAGALPAVDAVEDALLDEVAAGRRPGSRLSCQLLLDDERPGLVVRVPECQ